MISVHLTDELPNVSGMRGNYESGVSMTTASDVHLFAWIGENAVWLIPLTAFIAGSAAWALKQYLSNRESKFATSEALGECKKENTLEHKHITSKINTIEAKQGLIEAKQSIIEDLQINHHKETSGKLNNLHALLISIIKQDKD